MVKDIKKVVPTETSTPSAGQMSDTVVRFLKESKLELKKVTWPTKQELIANTIVVLISVFLCAAAIWVVDSIFSVVIRGILR
jgi:preprotein translocase subunit SecE